jgi:hypothetical protein
MANPSVHAHLATLLKIVASDSGSEPNRESAANTTLLWETIAFQADKGTTLTRLAEQPH